MSRSIFANKTPFEHFGLMYDNSRTAVMNVGTVKNVIDLMEKLDYNMLMLYTEDTYKVNNQPYFGHLRGKFSKKELKEIDAYAMEHGVELVPCIQTLAHFDALMHWEEYIGMQDCGNILCIGNEKFYKLLEDIFATLSECFTSKIVNIGMDEAEMVGLGQYRIVNGIRNRIDILTEHLERVSDIAKKYGFTLCMWSDMFFKLAAGGWTEQNCLDINQSVSEKIPDNVRLIYWDYYSTDKEHYDQWLEGHEKLKEGTLFAGGLWSWPGFAPHNRYSIRIGTAATQSCVEHQVKDVFYTIWGNNGGECSRYAILPSMFYNSCIAHGITEEYEIKQKFQECFEISFDDFMLLDLPNTDNDDNHKGRPNPEKHMLYCDCFLGKFDLNVREGIGAAYAQNAKKMSHLTDHSQYGYLFQTMKTLCEVLEVKFEIGVRTRKAYLSGNKQELSNLVAEYDLMLERIQNFYEAFRTQWLKENKPHGLDVHDIRIGGLLHRIADCKRRLTDYLEGRIDCLEELEEPVLDFACRGDYLQADEWFAFEHHTWQSIVTANLI